MRDAKRGSCVINEGRAARRGIQTPNEWVLGRLLGVEVAVSEE